MKELHLFILRFFQALFAFLVIFIILKAPSVLVKADEEIETYTPACLLEVKKSPFGYPTFSSFSTKIRMDQLRFEVYQTQDSPDYFLEVLNDPNSMLYKLQADLFSYANPKTFNERKKYQITPDHLEIWLRDREFCTEDFKIKSYEEFLKDFLNQVTINNSNNPFEINDCSLYYESFPGRLLNPFLQLKKKLIGSSLIVRKHKKLETKNPKKIEKIRPPSPQTLPIKVTSSNNVGLKNFNASTCFANSSFVLLSNVFQDKKSTSYLREVLEKFKHKKSQLEQNDPHQKKLIIQSNVIKILLKLLKDISNGHSDNQEELLKKLYQQFDYYLKLHPNTFREFQGGFIHSGQHDIIEFINFVFELLEIDQDPNSPFAIELQSQLINLETGKAYNKNKTELKPYHQFVKSDFAPTLEEEINFSLLSEPFIFTPEKTSKELELMNITTFKKLPQKFLVSLSRNEATQEKNSRAIAIEQSLTLNEVNQQNGNVRNVSYDLKSVIVHLSESNLGGHYISFVYNEKTKTWSLHNDEIIVDGLLLDSPFIKAMPDYTLRQLFSEKAVSFQYNKRSH